MINQLSSKIVYKNKWMVVKEDKISFPDGSKGIYGTVEKPHFALIIPYFGDGFQLVKQYRYAVKGSFWEFPQGMYEENPKINPVTLAKNELLEETGLVTGSIKKIGFLYEAYGYCNQGFHIFLAENLIPGPTKKELSEQNLVSKRFSLKEFNKMINNGEILDGPSVSAYGLAKIKNLL